MKLSSRKNKTEEELKASRSFTSMCAQTLCWAVLGILALFLILHFVIPEYPGIARIGTRKGDEVTYVYQTVRSIPYDEIGLEVEDGQGVALFLAQDGSFISAMDKSEYQTEKDRSDLIVSIVCIGGGLLIIFLVAMVPKRAGKDFYDWVDAQKTAKKK